MARGAIERVLNPNQLNRWFDHTAEAQHTTQLLFSSPFDIMSLLVLGSHRSAHAAYQVLEADIGVSITSIYNQLNGIEVNPSAQLVRHAIEQLEPLVKKPRGKAPSPLPGKRNGLNEIWEAAYPQSAGRQVVACGRPIEKSKTGPANRCSISCHFLQQSKIVRHRMQSGVTSQSHRMIRFSTPGHPGR